MLAPETGGMMLSALAIVVAIYLAAGVAISASPLARRAIALQFWLLTSDHIPLRRKLAKAIMYLALALAWPVLLPGAAAGALSQEPVRLLRAVRMAAKSYRNPG